MHNVIIEVDIRQLITNLKSIKEYVNRQFDNTRRKIKVCLPVKANAYGHGLVGVAKVASPYVDYFGVACLNEGALLRANGITKPILVFGAFSEEQIPGLSDNDLEITVSSLYKARLVVEFCRQFNRTCKVHIKIDVGMNRVGVRPESSYPLIDFICQNSDCVTLTGIYSHLSCSDELDSPTTLEQIELFKPCALYAKQKNSDVICHLANSGGVYYYPDSYFDMVRPGLLSYGYFPEVPVLEHLLNNVASCLQLKANVSYFKVVFPNQGISYNKSYITKDLTHVVTIPIGYGDGYRRALSNIGQVIIRGKRYTISGAICMDMCMVDIGSCGEAYVGDEVILIGKSGNEVITLHDVAKQCDTIIYEILCGFSNRIPRIYL